MHFVINVAFCNKKSHANLLQFCNKAVALCDNIYCILHWSAIHATMTKYEITTIIHSQNLCVFLSLSLNKDSRTASNFFLKFGPFQQPFLSNILKHSSLKWEVSAVCQNSIFVFCSVVAHKYETLLSFFIILPYLSI